MCIRDRAMFMLMDEYSAGFVQMDWVSVQDQLENKAVPERMKDWLSWDGQPDEQRMLSREDWFGALKDLHTAPGYVSGSRFAALLELMESLIQEEVDRRWKAEMEYRCLKLGEVFVEFDYDANNSLDIQELLRLGAARPRTQGFVWTDSRNKELLSEMDTDGDNKIQSGEFVGFLNDDLPRRRADFDTVIEEFLRIARLARAEREALANVKIEMSEDEIRRVKALFVALDADNSGSLEVKEIVIVRADDQKNMITYLDHDDDNTVSLTEWMGWHEFVFENLPTRYSTYSDFLTLLESLLDQWRITEEKRRALASVSPVRQEWSRARRVARSPRSPRSPRKTASKALLNYKGHSDWILSVAVVQVEGKQLVVSASQDNTARVFDMESGEPVATCSAHNGSVLAIAWIPSDPTNLFTGSLDGQVCHWDLFSGELVSENIDCHKKGVLCIQASVDGSSIFTGSRDNTAAQWNVNTGEEIQRYTGHSKWIQCLALSGSKLYTGGADETVKEWDVASGACLHTLRGHTQEVISMVVSGTYLYTGSREATAKRWDLTTKEVMHTYVGHLSVVRDVAIHQGYLFTGSADGTARCWDVETGECKFTLTGHEFAVTSLALADSFIFTGSSDATVRKFALQHPLGSPSPRPSPRQ
eukprot:TRINITY_DN32571_c0_g1_i2.p1 TRINITY_DN32571_c0_g1~~TRINITY_DN32571_c0_g1_i2.p1  ORF type:complete len:696 (-),score=173.28 TRINITY_DN32571_c0_g1_i2:92-2026(-)